MLISIVALGFSLDKAKHCSIATFCNNKQSTLKQAINFPKLSGTFFMKRGLLQCALYIINEFKCAAAPPY